jgi:hypothetical protein
LKDQNKLVYVFIELCGYVPFVGIYERRKNNPRDGEIFFPELFDVSAIEIAVYASISMFFRVKFKLHNLGFELILLLIFFYIIVTYFSS